MNQNNIIDNLFHIDGGEEELENFSKSLLSEEISIPNKCLNCKTSLVCSILPTFINLSKIKVTIIIDKCPFSQPIKNAKQEKNNN